MPLTLRSVRPVRALTSPPGPAGRSAPWRLLLGFAVLLCALFAVSFGVGRLVGPVSVGPGRHGGSTPGMPGMPGMAGMHMDGLGVPSPVHVEVAGAGR
jgi:hypothetical protein